MGRSPKILIVGGFSFSRGAGGSNYVIGLGKALSEAGFCVEYLCDDRHGKTVRQDFQEFTCHAVSRGPSLRGWKAAWKNLSASEDALLKWLERVPSDEFQIIIAYPGGLPVAFLWRLRRLCAAKAWKTAAVVVEWQQLWKYYPSKLRNLLLDMADQELQIRLVNKRFGHIIAISSLLERYYRKSGCKVIRIPPMIDAEGQTLQRKPTPKQEAQGLRLLFSGAWLRDRLDIIVKAVLLLRGEGKPIALEFLGPGVNDLRMNPNLQKQIMEGPEGAFRFHGWVPLEEARSITMSADFGILLRERARWSNACFPSKVAEFQALGVPLLCNLTSDLAQSLRDGDNALIVHEVTVEALVATLRRGLALTSGEKARLKQGSLECAASIFDYRKHAEPLGAFFRGILNN